MSRSAKTLFWFQAVNLVATVLVMTIVPTNIGGLSVIYALFSIKVIALIYFNEFPAKKNAYSVVFFALACVEVFLLFLTGSFSIFSFLYWQIF